MKSIFGAACATLVLASLTPAQVWANPQHERMKRCNAEAKTQALKGEERKAFMGGCLRGKHDAAAGAAPAAVPAAVPAAALVPAAAPVVAAAPAAAQAAAAPVAVATADKAREKACNRAATEQSLRGAKRKAFITECLSG